MNPDLSMLAALRPHVSRLGRADDSKQRPGVQASDSAGHAPVRGIRPTYLKALAASCATLPTLSRCRRSAHRPRRSLRMARRAQNSGVLPEPELPRPSETALVWFRSGDLRVEDHPGLARAATAPKGVLCCYIFEAKEIARLSARRMKLLRAAVEDLRQQLKSRYGLLLHVCAARSGPEKVYELSKDVNASDVYVHEDPVDLHMESLQELQSLSRGNQGQLRVHPWHAPLRLGAGSLSSECRCYDEYASARETSPTEPWQAPAELEAPALEHSQPSWLLEGLPDDASLREVLRSDERMQNQAALRESVSYVLGLGGESASEAEALRLLSLFTAQGAEALAQDAFGAARDREEVAKSKEEWAFRRVAGGPDGYRGLIPGEVFSRVLSEMMLWLGCISLRTAAAALRAGAAEEDCREALEALEANEWHRLLALADLSDGKLFEHSDVRFFRWRGYLCRYIAPSCLPAADSAPPVLAIHGFAASCTQFAPLAAALAEGDTERPIPLYALDMIGFGHAEKPPLSITQYVWEQCVKDFLLSVVAAPAVLMGNSIGGYMAQSAAAFLGPSVCRGLILLNSAGPLLSMEDYQTLLRSSGGTVLERMRE
ncbi:cry, partial [Symbiodinium natans]